MNKAKFAWQERTSESKFVASVWTCDSLQSTRRTVLADPCTSISFVASDGNAKIVLSGPGTTSRIEFLSRGYSCTSIRLEPGVSLHGFPAHQFVNKSLAIPTDSALGFWFGQDQLQFPTFMHAELLVEQLSTLGYISYEKPKVINNLPSRSYYRLIKRTTGLSPYQLFQIERIYKALRLLKQGMASVDVAADLGFVDQSHLVHASRHYLGHTPNQLLYLPQNP